MRRKSWNPCCSMFCTGHRMKSPTRRTSALSRCSCSTKRGSSSKTRPFRSDAPEVLEPLLFYVLHRASNEITDPKNLGTFKMFLLDEAWLFIKNETIQIGCAGSLGTLAVLCFAPGIE